MPCYGWNTQRNAMEFYASSHFNEINMRDAEVNIQEVVSAYPYTPFKRFEDRVVYEMDETDIELFQKAGIDYYTLWQSDNDIQLDILCKIKPFVREKACWMALEQMMTIASAQGMHVTIDHLWYYN